MLDLIAKRYPGTRPSDLYGRQDDTLPPNHPDNIGKLDEYMAFQLDAALALRYDTLEKEDFARSMHEVRESIKLTGRYHGVKRLKYRRFQSNLGDTHDPDEDEDASTGGVYGGIGKGSAIES